MRFKTKLLFLVLGMGISVSVMAQTTPLSQGTGGTGMSTGPINRVNPNSKWLLIQVPVGTPTDKKPSHYDTTGKFNTMATCVQVLEKIKRISPFLKVYCVPEQ